MSTDAAVLSSEIETVRAARLRLQRLLGIAERFTDSTDPAARLDETVLVGLTGHALRQRYDHVLVPSARKAARSARAQLHRLRMAEAAYRGVPLAQVDKWVPEHVEADVEDQPQEVTR